MKRTWLAKTYCDWFIVGMRSHFSLDPALISRRKNREQARVDMSHVSRVLNIPTDKVYWKEGPIDRLIGINYARSHVGETGVKDRLVARRRPFGWVVFRSNSDDVLPEAKPVDITEFFKTESMDVSVSPYTYEAAKMSSEERTELKLIDYSCELEGNKWMMKYPWKRDTSSFPDNYTQVLKGARSRYFR